MQLQSRNDNLENSNVKSVGKFHVANIAKPFSPTKAERKNLNIFSND